MRWDVPAFVHVVIRGMEGMPGRQSAANELVDVVLLAHDDEFVVAVHDQFLNRTGTRCRAP